MNYHNITKDDMLNGDGLRVVLWVAGCDHHCVGCQNPITWKPDGGIPFDANAYDEIIDELYKDYVSGITFSGGDPLHPANRFEVMNLCEAIYNRFHRLGKTIWIYTGYLWEDVKDIPGMQFVDVLVDGPFMKELAEENYPWAGSTNQRVVDVKQSLKSGTVVLHV